MQYLSHGSQDPGGVVTTLRDRWSRNWGSILGSNKMFVLFSKAATADNSSINWLPTALFPGIKQCFHFATCPHGVVLNFAHPDHYHLTHHMVSREIQTQYLSLPEHRDRKCLGFTKETKSPPRLHVKRVRLWSFRNIWCRPANRFCTQQSGHNKQQMPFAKCIQIKTVGHHVFLTQILCL